MWKEEAADLLSGRSIALERREKDAKYFGYSNKVRVLRKRGKNASLIKHVVQQILKNLFLY